MGKALSLVLLTLALAGPSEAAGAAGRAASAAAALNEIMAVPGKNIPAEILSSARCVAVAPSLPKVLGFAGARVRGFASCRVAYGWSAPAPLGVAGDGLADLMRFKGDTLVLLIMSEKGRTALSSGKLRLGTDASVAAGPVTSARATTEVLSYLRARGLFAGYPLNGLVLEQDEVATRELYGRMVPNRIILKGAVAAPLEAETFVSALRSAAPSK